MPSIETPPNSAPPTPPVKVRTGRFGELEEHELVHLLDSLDDERSKARFRESIYISLIVYLFIAWFLFYGPRVIFHQPRLISPVDVLKDRDKLTYLDTPKNLPNVKTPKNPKAISDRDQIRQTAHLDKKTLEQLRRPGNPAPPAPAPAPAQQQPAPQQPTQAQQPPPPAPLPQHPAQQPQQLADAPRPAAPARPDFSSPSQSAGDAIQQAARNAARSHGGGGGDLGDGPVAPHSGAATGVEILSDTQNVDFGPYLRHILADIKRNWLPLIPEEARPPLNKQGETLIRFTILPDGRLSAMNLDASTQDVAMDRAAWGAIKATTYPPLPSSFHGPLLELRIDFLVNRTPKE